MKAFLKSVTTRLLALLLTASVAFAQDRGAFRQEELDQMLAPIALYPDPLLSQILMASTYPLEVVQAARWSRSNSHLQGQDAVRAVEPMDWDPSVKSLVAFPQILHRMDEQLDWTQRLGEAFLAQEPHVMDAIQGLRQRAAAAGNLRSNEQMRVARQDDYIMIEPARPEVVYVPYYNPAVVYGPWWWPAYPPVYWGPPAGYYVGPGYWPGFFWGSGIVISTGFFFGHCNWHHRHVTVVHKHVQVVQTRFGKPHTIVTPNAKPVAWKHDPAHRKGVPYRHAVLRKEFGRPGASSGDARRDQSRPGMAQAADHRDGGRPAGLREGSPDARGSFNTNAPASTPARPAVQGNDRRSQLNRGTVRAPERSSPHQPAHATSVARPVAANPGGIGQRAAVPERARYPEARSSSDRGNVSRQNMTMDSSAPAPRLSASSGNPVSRMGNGSHRSGGGAIRQQSRGTAVR